MNESQSNKTLMPYRNKELDVCEGEIETWMRSDNRRRGFHSLSDMCRSGWMIRAPEVLPLILNVDRAVSRIPEVRELTSTPYFSSMVIIQDQRILFERYANDFGPSQRHSMQSVTKTITTLVIGKLVEEGLIDLSKKVADYIPEIGSGYAGATIQDVLDMNVVNNFEEDFVDSYERCNDPAAIQGYHRFDAACGFRLPPPGEKAFGLHEYIGTLTSDDTSNPSGITQYKSTNTELLGWIAETVSGGSLYPKIVDVVEAAGIEGSYYLGTDIHGVPVVSGAGAMTARDLARYGLIFACGGVGMFGQVVGSKPFLDAVRSGQGTNLPDPREGAKYSNQMITRGEWFGHLGYCGQGLLVHPGSKTVIAFFSVLEATSSDDDSYYAEIIAMGEAVFKLMS